MFNKIRVERNILNLVKHIHKNSQLSYVIFKTWMPFLLTSVARQGCLFSRHLFHIALEFLARAIRHQRNKRHQGWKRSKTDDMTLYIENTKELKYMRSNTWGQQVCRIQDQYININCIFILAMSIAKNVINNSIQNTIKKNKIVTHKFNKRRCMLKTMKHCWKIHNKIS